MTWTRFSARTSIKRVAGAVGEGSVAVGSVHQYLAELGR